MALDPEILAPLIYDFTISLWPPGYEQSGDPDAVAQARTDALRYADGLAAILCDFIRDHAVVTVRVQPADAGLQRDPDTALPTLGPVAEVVLTGGLE